MFAQARGRLGDGTDPPPDSRLPRWSLVIFEVSASTEARSAWVIWPIFSSSVIRLSRSETRCPIGREASRYTSLRVDCAAAALFEAVADGDCRAVSPGSAPLRCREPRHGCAVGSGLLSYSTPE